MQEIPVISWSVACDWWQWGMSPWWPSLMQLSWYPIFKSNKLHRLDNTIGYQESNPAMAPGWQDPFYNDHVMISSLWINLTSIDTFPRAWKILWQNYLDVSNLQVWSTWPCYWIIWPIYPHNWTLGKNLKIKSKYNRNIKYHTLGCLDQYTCRELRHCETVRTVKVDEAL